MKVLFFLLISCALFGKELHPMTKINQWCQKEKEWTEGPFVKRATLATITPQGRPHTEGIEIAHLGKKEGPLFFTKRDLSHSPFVALHLYLPRTHRTISIEGTVHQISMTEKEKRWEALPLYKKRLFLSEKSSPKEASMPPTFVGYRVAPNTITFSESSPRSPPIQEVSNLD